MSDFYEPKLFGADRTDELEQLPRMRCHIAILAIALLIGCSPDSQSPTPSLAEIATGYTKFRLMTPKPIYVAPASAMACTSSWHERVVDARITHGPHAQTVIEIYMNDLAKRSFTRSAGNYPVGSIIVKQKRALRYRTDNIKPEYHSENDGVGGMIKRPPGYDPAHGDWEYFYFEDPTKIESGRLPSCVQCHVGAARTDFVFGDWKNGG